MTPMQYLLLAYAIGLGLLWGYALRLIVAERRRGAHVNGKEDRR